jgi:3D (Asp-Asp-Asp) domain-containing protein
MRKVFYSFLVLTLILMPMEAFGEPQKTELVEPKTSVIPTNGAISGFSTIDFVLPNTEIMSVRTKEERPETQMVTAKAVEPTVHKPKGNKQHFTLTAYSNDYRSTGKNQGDPEFGITASGSKTREGVTIAADWTVLPKGTRVYIAGLGVRVVQDKGSAIKGNKIDIYFESEQDALDFGRKKNAEVVVFGEN